MGYGRLQECSSERVPHVISVRRPPGTTGVLDQNLDQATPGTDLVPPPLRAKGTSKDQGASQGH